MPAFGSGATAGGARPVSAGRSALLPPLLARPWLPLFLLLAVASATLAARPPIGGLDTPALAAGWDVLRAGDWLGWQAAGGQAARIAPLLPWLLALAWSALGVGTGIASALVLLLLAAGAMVTREIGTRLWPQRQDLGPLSSWSLVGSAGVLLLGPSIAPEALGLALTAAGLLGLVLAAEGRRFGWPLFALSLALLLLTVGAGGLLILLAPALAVPARPDRATSGWRVRWHLALSGTAALACLPAVLVAAATGEARAQGDWLLPGDGPSLAPLLALPLFFYPWPCWPRFWRSARRQSGLAADPAVRFCLVALLVPLAGFIAEGAGVARLLLLAPAASILIARLLAGRLPGRADFHAAIPALPLALVCALPIAINAAPWAQLAGLAWRLVGVELPIWIADLRVSGALLLMAGTFLVIQAAPRVMLARAAQIAMLPMLLAGALGWEMTGALGRAFDLTPIAQRLSELQSRGAPLAVFAVDPSIYTFAGRLEQAPAELPDAQAALDWARAHPDGVLLAPIHGSVLHLPLQPDFAALQGPRWVALWPARSIVESQGARLAGPP